jgi:hypothetical protein
VLLRGDFYPILSLGAEAGDLKHPAKLENFCMVFRLKRVEGEVGKFY